MRVGIIASTQTEADLIIKQLSQKEDNSIQGKSFYKGILGQKTEFIICICGVGKVNAAHTTALLIEKFKPDLIYIVGVGGAYPSSGLKIGDIVIAEKEIYGDEGLITSTNFHTMDKVGLPLATIDRINYYNEFSMHISEKFKIQNSKFKVKTGNFITVSACTGTLERGIEIEKRFNAICENMEGAAIAHVCAFSGILSTEIRGISNIIKDRAAEPLNKADIIKAGDFAQTFFLERLI